MLDRTRGNVGHVRRHPETGPRLGARHLVSSWAAPSWGSHAVSSPAPTSPTTIARRVALRLSALNFLAGAGPGSVPLRVPAESVVLLVGPNNSGKSTALRELETWCQGADAARVVVGDPEVVLPEVVEEAERLLAEIAATPPADRPVRDSQWYVRASTFGPNPSITVREIDKSRLTSGVQSRNMAVLRSGLLGPFTVRLDGRTRFALVAEADSGDLLGPPPNHLAALFQDEARRRQVRDLAWQAFRSYFVIDPTNPRRLRIRMATRAPNSTSEEQSYDRAARDFHSAQPLITDLGDGVQSFVGLISAVTSLPHRIILIDEPEAFLYAPLARRLGRDLVRLAFGREGTLVLATHSADILRGCIEESASAAIVRLTYTGGIPTARTMGAEELRTLTRNPLLRSANALSAIFHEAVVVTEGDTDRAFYDEINRRLQEASEDRGLRDALFLNAQNWQTIERIVAPLRRLGIPAAAIYDLDIVTATDGNAWPNLLRAAQIPLADRGRLLALRGQVQAAFRVLADEGSKTAAKSPGVAALPEPARTAVENLLEGLRAYGVFLIPPGEVETWLSELRVPGDGTNWLISMLTRMGADNADAGYVRPGAGDVWDFVQQIANWTNDPTRLGVTSESS